VEKAREVTTYDPVPQGEDHPDPEKGEAEPQWATWARQAAGRVKNQMAEATKEARQGIAQAAEKAKSVEWGEQAQEWKSGLSKNVGKVTESATTATSALSEKSKQAAKDLQSKSSQKLSEAKQVTSARAQAVAGKAASAAGSAKALAAAGAGKVTSGISGLTALAMSPQKLAQFGGVFFVGVFLISMSFTYLPLLPIAPQKFALLFAVGSSTLMASFAILKGPQAFVGGLMARDKLPFSATYVVGLVGTLVATIVLRSYVFTAIFSIIQFIALLYFLASYVPGGQACLNFMGRLGRTCARKVCRHG